MWTSILAGFGLLAAVVASPLAPRAAPTYKPNANRANAVKDVFQRGWNGYYKYAFPHDSLRPASNSYQDDR